MDASIDSSAVPCPASAVLRRDIALILLNALSDGLVAVRAVAYVDPPTAAQATEQVGVAARMTVELPGMLLGEPLAPSVEQWLASAEAVPESKSVVSIAIMKRNFRSLRTALAASPSASAAAETFEVRRAGQRTVLQITGELIADIIARCESSDPADDSSLRELVRRAWT